MSGVLSLALPWGRERRTITHDRFQFCRRLSGKNWERWVRRSKTAQAAGVAGTDRAGECRRQANDMEVAGQLARPSPSGGDGFCAPLRWPAGRAETGGAAHDWARRGGAGGGANLGDDSRRCYALEHALDGQGVRAECSEGTPHLPNNRGSQSIAYGCGSQTDESGGTPMGGLDVVRDGYFAAIGCREQRPRGREATTLSPTA